jgi:hypothetical protein
MFRRHGLTVTCVLGAWVWGAGCDEPAKSGTDASAPAADGAPLLGDDAAADSVAQSGDGGVQAGVDVGAPRLPTLVVLPDTQFYAAGYPEIFRAQTTWIAENHVAANLVAVLHEGDIVDGANDPAQWQVASDSFARLDGVLPYLVLAGNHDEDADRHGLMDQYFPPSRFNQYPWFMGTFEAGKTENSVATVRIGSSVWLLLALEFGPRHAVVAWADAILKAFPTTPAILVTHAYLYNDGSRYDVNKTPPQSFEPDGYNYTPLEGMNDGEELWQKLIVGNENVKLVLSGHCLGDPANAMPAAARLTSVRPSGSKVHQMLANYQICADMSCFTDYPELRGGNGYLRLLEFDETGGTIHVRTYSPYLRQYLTDDSEDFTLAWP